MSRTPPGWWFESSAGEPPLRRRWRRRRRTEPQVVAAVERQASYNLWMTTSQTAAARPSAPPADLTVDEAVRIADAITAAHPESTRTVYAWAWSQWERWCAGRGATAMPAEPAMICAYLTERAADGLSVGTIDLACGAIAYRHRLHGQPDPILTEGVRQVRRGLRRIIGAAPRRQARRLGTDDIRTIVEAIDRSTALGARDAALILLGFASAMRRSELAALTLVDVEFQPSGVLLTIRRSKTDQDAEGQVVAVVHGQHAAWPDRRSRRLARVSRHAGRTPVHQPEEQDGHPRVNLRRSGLDRAPRARPGRRPGRRADHRPLTARRTCHQRGCRQRRPGPDRRADKA